MTAATADTATFNRSGYSDQIDDEFAVGAARYLRRAGLGTDAIAASLADELGLGLDEATRLAHAA